MERTTTYSIRHLFMGALELEIRILGAILGAVVGFFVNLFCFLMGVDLYSFDEA